MTAAAKFERRNKKCRLVYFWAIILFFFSSLVAIFLPRVINVRPDIVNLLREVGFALFWSLTFISCGLLRHLKLKKGKIKKSSQKKRFF
jgi:hypothetical protein